MKVLLKDKTEIYVTEEEAENIKQALTESDSGFLEIGQHFLDKKRIVEIKPGGLTKVDLAESNILPGGKICTGKYSIQNEINNIAKHDYPDNWQKKIQDHSWREQIRKRLRGANVDWCDYKANECNC